jgi:hypothetical protein
MSNLAAQLSWEGNPAVKKCRAEIDYRACNEFPEVQRLFDALTHEIQ